MCTNLAIIKVAEDINEIGWRNQFQGQRNRPGEGWIDAILQEANGQVGVHCRTAHQIKDPPGKDDEEVAGIRLEFVQEVHSVTVQMRNWGTHELSHRYADRVEHVDQVDDCQMKNLAHQQVVEVEVKVNVFSFPRMRPLLRWHGPLFTNQKTPTNHKSQFFLAKPC